MTWQQQRKRKRKRKSSQARLCWSILFTAVDWSGVVNSRFRISLIMLKLKLFDISALMNYKSELQQILDISLQLGNKLI